MALYTVTQNYRSGIGAYAAGDQVDLADDFAEHINRDAPGTLEPVIDEPVSPDPEPDSSDEEDASAEDAEEESEGEESEGEEGDAEERQIVAPPADRMVKGARRRDREGDPSDEGAITKDDFKAVRDGE